ncbi:hypothetical protein PUN28_005689 [Cardiocondyla obscurior]|uniref:Uncharacterized protein n=1 Tax=Cardiocondyla obscurior TaxID=286306 RepID=A0AAW2G7Y6_9HYME
MSEQSRQAIFYISDTLGVLTLTEPVEGLRVFARITLLHVLLPLYDCNRRTFLRRLLFLRTVLSVITTNNSAVIASVTLRGSTCNWNFNDCTAVLYKAAGLRSRVTYISKNDFALFFSFHRAHTIIILSYMFTNKETKNEKN